MVAIAGIEVESRRLWYSADSQDHTLQEKISGKGRTVIDLGDLKGEAVRASRKRKMKLAAWIREAVEEKIERES
jgi:hypothetical protein